MIVFPCDAFYLNLVHRSINKPRHKTSDPGWSRTTQHINRDCFHVQVIINPHLYFVKQVHGWMDWRLDWRLNDVLEEGGVTINQSRRN